MLGPTDCNMRVKFETYPLVSNPSRVTRFRHLGTESMENTFENPLGFLSLQACLN